MWGGFLHIVRGKMGPPLKVAFTIVFDLQCNFTSTRSTKLVCNISNQLNANKWWEEFTQQIVARVVQGSTFATGSVIFKEPGILRVALRTRHTTVLSVMTMHSRASRPV